MGEPGTVLQLTLKNKSPKRRGLFKKHFWGYMFLLL